MNTITTLKTLATSLALALSLGTAAHAGDFEDAYPGFAEQANQTTPAQAAAQRVEVTAAALKRSPSGSVSTEESRAMLGEDSGSFWITQHDAATKASTVARADVLKR